MKVGEKEKEGGRGRSEVGEKGKAVIFIINVFANYCFDLLFYLLSFFIRIFQEPRVIYQICLFFVLFSFLLFRKEKK